MKKRLIILFFLSIGSIVFVNAQCPTIAPATTDGCRLGTGSVELGASGSSGFYNWYDASTGGAYLGSGSTFNSPSISSTTNFYASSADIPSSLTFDGTNDYIGLNMSFNTPGEINQLTVEAWVNTSETGTGTFDNWAIVDFDRSEYFNVFISGTSGEVGFSTTNIGGTIHDFYSGAINTVNDGNWHHIVAVYDGIDKIIYIDGIEVARNTNPHGGSNLGTGVTRFGFIGDGSESATFNGSRNNLFYNGSTDEVRIWNTTRTPAQILNNKDICLTGSETSLMAYYNFNETTGTVLNDITGNGNNGTLFNFNLALAWSVGDLISCPSCESSRTLAVANVITSSISDQQLTCGNSSITFDAGTGFSSYLWNTGATSQTINITEQGIYSVSVTGGPLGCAGGDTASVVGFTSSENALTFDGTNDYIAIENFNYSGTGYSELTVEAWIKTSSGGNQIISSYDRNQFWRLEINGNGAGTGQVGFDLMTNTGQLDFGGTIRIDDGNWHHVAGVFDNGTVSIYIDGVLDATTSRGTTFGSNVTRYGFVGTGSEASSYNGSRGPNDEFNGEMDEFRIWNTARTLTEIRAGMCTHIPGNETGLQIYYKFDETSGTTINDYGTSVISNGNMINFPGSAHTESDVPLGDVSAYLYPGSWTGQSINLSSCDGDNISLNNFTGSTAGSHLYYVNQNPNATSGILNYTTGNHYYGSFVTNGSSQYDITWNYLNHNLILPTDETGISILMRLNNSASPWSLSSSSTNTTTKEITLTNQSAGQFIIDHYEIVWTGTTSTNWAIGSNWSSGSVPPPGASISVPNVTNQPVLDQDRTIGNLSIDPSADIDLNAFNLSLNQHLTNNGNIIANNGTISFINNSNTQLIYANTNLELFDLTINNPNGVNLNNGTIDLIGTLTLTDGTFNTGGNSFTLISNATGTARIAEITGGAIAGDITMQRYIDAGATNWRFLSSAVSGTALSDFNDDFITSGFTGSDYPLWPTAADPWKSIYFYDETLPGTVDDGFVPATNITNTLAVGEGIWVWSGDTITGTQPFTIDMTGPTNTGSINLPVSYTNTGSPNDDGWTMVGNPYPSTIDWDDPSIVKTNINNAVYIWNPDLEQFASYVPGIGGINGGSKNIASSQAFWVQANATSPILTITEATKTTDGGVFLKQASPSHLTIEVLNNSGKDETIINFNSNATSNFDGQFDALKIITTAPNLPSISTMAADATEFSINQLPEQEINIPLKITTGNSGLHQINFKGMSNFSNAACIIIEDLFTGSNYNLNKTNSFNAFIYDTTTTARFLIKFGASTKISTDSLSCYGNNDGQILFEKNSPTPFDVIWKDNSGKILANKLGITAADRISNLATGTYTIETSDSTCGNNIDTVIINEPLEIIAEFKSSSDTIDLSYGGNISFTNHSLNANYYNWDFDDANTSISNSPTHQYKQPGTYLITLDAFQHNNCFKSINKEVTVLNTITGIDQKQTLTENNIWINNNHLIVDNTVYPGINSVEIRNTTGQLIHRSSTIQNQVRFNLNNFASQTFVISIFKNNSTSSRKINFIKK